MEPDHDDDAPRPFGWWESLAVPAFAIVALVLLAMLAAVLVYLGVIDAIVEQLHEGPD